MIHRGDGAITLEIVPFFMNDSCTLLLLIIW